MHRVLRWLCPLGFVLSSVWLNQPVQGTDAPARLTPQSGQPDLLHTAYNLDGPTEAMLRQNGFVVLPGAGDKSLSAAYPPQSHGRNLYVTTDAMLDLWYSMNRDMLKSAEQSLLLPDLQAVVPALARSASALRSSDRSDPASRSALREVTITLNVAQRLLNPGPHPDTDLNPNVADLLGKIMAHSKVESYPGEDYTQYTVRGHYADDPDLARYFRASMWLSRHFYSVSPIPGAEPDGPLRAVIAFAAAMRATPQQTQRRLAEMNRLRQSLAGSPDALSLPQLGTALDRVLGANWPLPRAMRSDALALLRRELRKPTYTVSQIITRVTTDYNQFPTQTVALLPGIAVPDGVLFQHTVDPHIPLRILPRGIEVGAALGFPTARRVLGETEGSRAQNVLAAVDRYGAPLARDDGRSVYSAWLHTLSTLKEVPANAPAYMRNGAWQAAKLNTAQASWAQLRHSYLLYSNQSYALTMGESPPARSLVEPNPAFFHALTSLATRTQGLLTTTTPLAAATDRRLTAYATKCREFEADARAELAGTLTQAQSDKIEKFGEWLIQFPDTNAAQVADVATGSEGEVLHAATGQLNTILVMPDPKTGTVYFGATMSYYEFARPNYERLTDATWQTLVTATYLRPERPAWTADFLAPPCRRRGRVGTARPPAPGRATAGGRQDRARHCAAAPHRDRQPRYDSGHRGAVPPGQILL